VLTFLIIFTGGVYLRGWLAIRKTRAARFTATRLSFFFFGLAVLWLAIASPLDDLADVALSAHMTQHLLLMSAVPPLLLLGWPAVPLLRGVPRKLIVPLLRIHTLHRLGRWLVSPLIAWMLMNVVFLAWHVPSAYEFALEHESWHRFEHVCFLGSSLAFWWSIVHSRRNTWGALLYLLSADLVNTALSAFLAFCDFPVYRYYWNQPNPFHLSPLSDQVLGAAIMWVGGSTAFLIPAAWITFRLLETPSERLA
jgi:putative membrane protein